VEQAAKIPVLDLSATKQEKDITSHQCDINLLTTARPLTTGPYGSRFTDKT
jgi:hypothetical protein